MAMRQSPVRRAPRRHLAFLLKSHYLADEFPSVLTTANFAKFCEDNLASLAPLPDLLKRVTRYGTFSAPRTTSTRRVLALPHPASQLALSRIITENLTDIRKTIRSCSLSLYNTDADYAHDRLFVGVDFKARGVREAQVLSRYPYILKADIANFFHTIYSHSLPWAVLGKQWVKDVLELRNDPQRKTFDESWPNRLDMAIQRGNSRETFGIPVGPDTSRMIAEILLSGIYADASLSGMLKGQEGCRLVDDFFIGFDDEHAARRCLDALRRVLWEYNLHLNEDKTDIKRSGQFYDDGWKHDIETFTIPKSSTKAQRSAVQRLMEITLHHCSTRNDPVPASFFCQRLTELEIMPANFEFVRDCLLRIARDFTTCLKAVVRFVTEYRLHFVDSEPLAIMRRYCRQIFAAHGPRGHDMEVVSALGICGVLGIKVDKAFVQLRDGYASPVVLAVLGLLGEEGLIKEPWDDWRPDMDGNIIDGPFWLPSYEAACRKWTNALEISESVAADPLFGMLAEHQVTFLDASDFKGKATSLPLWKQGGRGQRAIQRGPVSSGRRSVVSEYE